MHLGCISCFTVIRLMNVTIPSKKWPPPLPPHGPDTYFDQWHCGDVTYKDKYIDVTLTFNFIKISSYGDLQLYLYC